MQKRKKKQLIQELSERIAAWIDNLPVEKEGWQISRGFLAQRFKVKPHLITGAMHLLNLAGVVVHWNNAFPESDKSVGLSSNACERPTRRSNGWTGTADDTWMLRKFVDRKRDI